jgi:hypothetical protein
MVHWDLRLRNRDRYSEMAGRKKLALQKHLSRATTPRAHRQSAAAVGGACTLLGDENMKETSAWAAETARKVVEVI